MLQVGLLQGDDEGLLWNSPLCMAETAWKISSWKGMGGFVDLVL